MTYEPSRDPLGEALRSLPRARPAPDFTERVLERADPRRPRRGLAPATLRWAAALGTATALAAALLVLSPTDTRGPREAEHERLEALEEERLLLAAELEELRRLAASLEEPPPVLYLGGDDEIDLVLDLERLARDRPAGTGARPTAYDGRRPR